MKQNKLDRQTLYIKLLGGKCAHCGTKDYLQFDHINADTKSFNVSQQLESSVARVAIELTKCQLLCKYCHGLKTRRDNGFTSGTFHGLASTYRNYGCRCLSCRIANTIYCRQRRLTKAEI